MAINYSHNLEICPDLSLFFADVVVCPAQTIYLTDKGGMQMLAGWLGLLIALTWFSRGTPTGQTLHYYLVEIPVEKISTLNFGQVIFITAVLILMPSFTIVFSIDLAFIMALDFALYSEIMITGWTITSVARSRQFFVHLRSRLLAFVARFRPSRNRAPRKQRANGDLRSSNDNQDEHPVLALAA
jgi:hypothetical protein